MRKIQKLAAVFAVFLMALCFFSTAAYAAPDDETDTENGTVENETISLPPGTGTVVDVFTGEDGRKFYAIQTPAGNTFYLIVDFTKQAENVYFLDAVQEKDLLALAEKDNSTNSDGNADTAVNTSDISSEPSGNQTTPEPENNGDNNLSSMILIIVVVAIGGGTGIYFKIIRKKQRNDIRDEYEEDDYIPEIPESDGEDYDTEPEDDSPPWEED